MNQAIHDAHPETRVVTARVLGIGSRAVYLCDSQDRIAHMLHRVCRLSGFDVSQLVVGVCLVVEVWYSQQYHTWNVVRLHGLLDTPVPYMTSQFGDIRPACRGGEHVNLKTGEGLFGVYDSDGYLLYYVVIWIGAPGLIQRFVYTTSLKAGLEAIGKRLPVIKEVSGKTAVTCIGVAKPAKPKRVTVRGFEGLAAALQRCGSSDKIH